MIWNAAVNQAPSLKFAVIEIIDQIDAELAWRGSYIGSSPDLQRAPVTRALQEAMHNIQHMIGKLSGSPA